MIAMDTPIILQPILGVLKWLLLAILPVGLLNLPGPRAILAIWYVYQPFTEQ